MSKNSPPSNAGSRAPEARNCGRHRQDSRKNFPVFVFLVPVVFLIAIVFIAVRAGCIRAAGTKDGHETLVFLVLTPVLACFVAAIVYWVSRQIF
jgi:hypothetical protein